MIWPRKRRPVPAATEPEPGIRILRTGRLVLLAANRTLLVSDLEGRVPLARIAQAEVGDEWPPELYDRVTLEYALRQLDDPASHGWSLWYLVATQLAAPELIGICAFKGRPDERGSVEVSYSILPSHRNRGYASEAVACLLEWAFSHQHVNEVSAEVLAHLQQSRRVLEKCGFRRTGAGSERGVERYAVQRPDGR